MAVDAVQGSTGSQVAKSSIAGSISQTQDRFLKLLIAQLQNQDPMNPMDNAQMTTQLAQMSTVEGINNLNDNFKSLMTGMQQSQGLQAASMIGRTVMLPGNQLVSDGAGAQGALSLDGAADKLVVSVLDSSGNVVHAMDLGRHPAGYVRFEWDGRDNAGNPLPAGEYTFSVTASAAGEKVGVTSYAAGKVSGVYMADDGVKLDVAGMGVYAFSDVKQIL